MLNKNQIIDHIQEINRSARREWLDVFDERALEHYLDHLQRTLEPRGGSSRWQRIGDTRAVVTRRPSN